LGIFLFLFYKEGTLPVNKNSKETKIFVIKKGENLDTIIKNLAKKDLIRNRVVFLSYFKTTGD
jgi:cell division protein YceG involved in septum cleavage